MDINLQKQLEENEKNVVTKSFITFIDIKPGDRFIARRKNNGYFFYNNDKVIVKFIKLYEKQYFYEVSVDNSLLILDEEQLNASLQLIEYIKPFRFFKSWF